MTPWSILLVVVLCGLAFYVDRDVFFSSDSE